jgi:2-oxoglutarate ferredoxin oxidoreductase subunit beta
LITRAVNDAAWRTELEKNTVENPLLDYLRRDILPTPFCAGCGCGTVLNLFTRAIHESGIKPEEIVCVTGIGCSSWIPSPFFKCDTLHTTHGRAIAFATGIKVMKPNLKVIVIAGDGDIAGIGGNHLIHAARRNVGLSVFLVNNSIYAMTGGQVAPTTPVGILTTTTPHGSIEPPLQAAELVKSAGATYVARWTTYHVMQLKAAMKKAIAKEGFSFLEIVSQCPVSYGKSVGRRHASDFLNHYRDNSMRVKDAAGMSEEELAGKIVVGELCDLERPEFTESLRAINKRVRKEAAK